MGEQKREQQHNPFVNALRRHSLFVLVLACYLIASVYLAFRIAPLAGPDEVAHYAYITTIRTTGNAPPKFQQNEGHTKRLEPPAYYTLVAIASSLADDKHSPEFEPNPFYATLTSHRGNLNPVLRTSPMLIAARLATVVFGLLGLIGLYVALAQWLGILPAVCVAALLALQPSYLYFSATLNNDIAVVSVALWFFAAAIGIVLRGGSQLKYFGLGALWGVALLMQANAIVLGLALPIVWWLEHPEGAPLATEHSGGSSRLRVIIDSLAGFAVFYGPWFLNRLILAGPFDSAPTAWFANSHRLYMGLALVAGATTVLWLLARKPREDKPGFLKKPGLSSRLTLLLVLALTAFTLYRLVVEFQKAQPEARAITLAQIPSTATQTTLRYGPDQAIELAAIESPPNTQGTQGQLVDVPLYWRALKSPQHNYAVRAELVVPNGLQPLQLDEQITFPGYGYGTSLTQDWREGDLIADAISFVPTTTVALNGPTRAVIVINLLQLPAPPTQTLTATLPVWRDGAAVDFPSTQAITVRPAQPLSLPNEFVLPTPPQFAESIRLDAISTRWADGKLRLTFWWQATADVPTDFTIFTHVLNADGTLLAQSDGVPNAGLSPTLFWRTGDVIRDEREIEMTRQSGLTLALGFYDSASKERVAAAQAGQPLQDNVFRLPLP